MTLLEYAERGDLIGFDEKQQLTAEITVGSSEGSQDDSKVNKVAPQYLKNSLLYVEPSKFQPPGIFNSPMRHGYKDSLRHYDGLDIRNCNALAETIFRVLDGRKPEKLSLEDTRRFWYNLENCLENKFKEAETLTALEEKGTKNEAEEWSTPGSSLPHSLTTTLKPGGFFPLNKAFEHLDVKKISTLVISAVKKGKA